LDKICLGCHLIEPEEPGTLGVGKGHATGKKPSYNFKNLPLESDGTINCATTCHNLHVSKDDNPQLYQNRLRMNSNELCVSCHKI
ncbi:MAG: cytochrome c3 family protein, partial [Desulfuromonadaceae bacterium]|nr:cytochrome c3 family protein [Desulfuromonadaceae bacterium]